MEVKSFENFIKEAREEFRWALKGYIENSNQRLEFRNLGLKELLKKYLNRCCSNFEEETLKENLQEEFSAYLSSL